LLGLWKGSQPEKTRSLKVLVKVVIDVVAALLANMRDWVCVLINRKYAVTVGCDVY